ncbi:MAG: hypothetical protein ABI378_03545 [Chitinophagaceae bacterium]
MENENNYRGHSLRATWWDYRSAAAYFITICTRNRNHFFGEIDNGKMNLSRTGVIAEIMWNELKARHPFIELGEYVVMPNHIHGILVLNNSGTGINTDVEALRATPLEFSPFPLFKLFFC